MLTLGLSLLLSLSASASPATGPVHAVAIGDQDPAPNTNPDKRPEVEKLVDTLDAQIKKEGKEDTEAIGTIDLILQEFPKCGPKDRVTIVKQLNKSFEQRRMVPEGQPPNNKLYMASAVALGKMGPESVEVINNWIENKNHRKDLALQYRLIKSLGETKDKRALKRLKDLLTNKQDSLVSAAAEALGEFSGADLDARKDVFEALLKELMTAKGNKDQNPTDTTARDHFDVIAAPIITSLGKLSKHDERDPEKWQTWWNKNKKLDWDKEG